ncbi:Aspartic peptidase [Trema orientale]|uniref:Aspartic peptidase n=1 Tax=Trema orientale TaxID=63057 RepID=A0A2P5CM13_TREOI|nr:Aspartic peptidase [Trema orientale]
MSTSFTKIARFLFFLVITAFLNFHTTLARRLIQATTNYSLVLGLRHSRTTLLTPKSLSVGSSAKVQSESFAMMEPLRAVRDGYLIPLYLGSPPQVIQVYMDTGSDLTWVPCGNNLSFDCLDCDDYRDNKLTAAFSPSHSSSSARDLCSSSFCIDIHSSDNYIDPCAMAGCSLSNLVKSSCSRPCPSFAYTYGAGGVVTGVLTRDTIRVHENIDVSPNLTREISNFSFGCVGSSYREPIGIAGFGRGTLSLPSQLGLLRKGFSHCFLPFKFANNPNITSPLVIGDLAVLSGHEENLQFTPMLKSPILYPNYYYIGLEAITVGNSSSSEVPLSLREFDSHGNGGMLIDSGTTYTHLPEPIYSQLLSTLRSVISYPRAQDMEMRTGFDLCYEIPYTINSNNKTSREDLDFLPSITFHFLNNASLVLSGGSHFYAMGAPSNATVVKCLLFQSMEDSDYGPAGVFGSFQQQNVKVVYDLEKERIGFQPMECVSAAVSHGLDDRKP